MKRSLFFFVLFAIAMCVGAMTSAAQAQATRTWVSGLGDDANPCSRTAPCKTFAGAISKTAAGGEIDAMDPGGFGVLSITKAITIDGGGGIVASVLASSTYGIRVIAGANDFVTLRNLRINAVPQYAFPGTSPIIFNTGGVLNVENCVLEGGTGFGIDFEPSSGSHGDLHVNNTVIQDATGGGVLVSGNTATNRASITESTIINNGGFGVKSGLNSRVQITNSMVAGTGQVAGSGDGLRADGGVITVESTTVTGGGGIGIHSTNSGFVWISNATVTSNAGQGLTFDGGGQILSFLNNKLANNNGGGAQGAPSGNAVPGQI
jgi:hypothetical protein